MRSNTPLHPPTYSALSSLPNYKKGSPFQEQCSKPTSRIIPRHSFLIRLLIFALLEFGFIALASTASWKPIILHLPFTITEVKGALTAIAILWHTIAIYIVKDILLKVFSAEWMEQHRSSTNLPFQELDSVSRLTTGFFDQTGHFASKRATRPFRLGFMSSLLLILLNGLGPSAISTDFVPYDYPHDIQVASLNITPLSIDSINADVLAPYRANFITQLEVVEKNFTSYGFHIRQPNLLIPWPSSDFLSENTTITYLSDVIRYNFSCSWKTPSIIQRDRVLSWIVEGYDWMVYYPQTFYFTAAVLEDPLILPMRISLYEHSKEAENTTLVPFLLVGKNQTRSTTIDLHDIPSLLIPCNSTSHPNFGDHWVDLRDCEPLLASVLACEPRFEILPATIIGTSSSLEATILSGDPIVKNIPRQAAQVIFSKSLLDATSSTQLFPDLQFVNAISRQLFLSNLSFRGGNPAKPLSLHEINQNMNNVLASSAKAYLSGYKPSADDFTIPSFVKMNTTAVIEVQKMALVGSKPFLIASSIIDGLLVVLLATIVAITRADQLEGFELENIVKCFGLLNEDTEHQEGSIN